MSELRLEDELILANVDHLCSHASDFNLQIAETLDAE